MHMRTAIAAAAIVLISAPSFAAVLMDFPEHATLKQSHIPLAAYAFQRSAPPLARVCTGQGASGTFTVTKPVDAASPQLAEAAKTRTGTLVQLDDQKPDGARVAFRFNGAIINSITPVSGEQGMETVAFTYASVQWLTVGCAPPKNTARGNPGGAYGPSMGGGPAY